jgi:hypothetical protein
MVKNSSVVSSFDSYTGQRSLFYGKESLEAILKSGALSVITFKYDSRTEKPEFLVAAVEALKGSCCYVGGEQGSSEGA